jgi:hypothetical protein
VPPFVNNGRHVFVDPAQGSGDGQNLDAGYLVPPQIGLTIGGAPVVEQSHEYVIRKKPAPNAQD